MPINQEFPKNYQVAGKHKNADGQNYHYVWGPGRLSDVRKMKRQQEHMQQEEKNSFP